MKIIGRSVTIAMVLAIMWPGAAFGLAKYETDFSAHVSLEQEYTDNLRLMTVMGGEDYITSIRPGFSLAAVSEQSGLKLDYDLGASHYWNLDDQFLQHNAGGSVWQEWENLRFDANGNFVLTEYPIDISPETGDIIGLRNTVSPYYRATTTPGIAYEFGEERYIRAGYNYISYWSEDRRFQDSEMHAPNVTLTYAFNHFNVINLGYTYQTGNFSQAAFSDTSDLTSHGASGSYTHRFNPHLEGTASYSFGDLSFESGGGYQTHQGSLGINYGPSENTSLSLTAGYYRIALPTGDQDGPVVNGTISQKLPGGQISVSGNWGFGENYYTSENLGVYSYWGGRIFATYKLWERLNADANAGYRNADYYLKDRTDQYWNVGAGLSYILRSWLTARASYAHTRYWSDTEAGFSGILWNFTTNSYLIGLTATYD